MRSSAPTAFRPSRHWLRSARSRTAKSRGNTPFSTNALLPELDRHGIRIVRRESWTVAQKRWVQRYFRQEVAPMMTPIGLDPTHPFPLLVNKSLNFIVELEGVDAFGRDSGLAILPAPRVLPRIIRLPEDICEGGENYVLLSSIIHAHADELFPGMEVLGCYQFRLTRNADLTIDPEEMDDLARALRGELSSRRFGDAVRLEVADNCPKKLTDYLLKQFGLTEAELYEVNGPVNLTRLFGIVSRTASPQLQYPPFVPAIPKVAEESRGLVPGDRQAGCAVDASVRIVLRRWWTWCARRRKIQRCSPSSRRFIAPAPIPRSSTRWWKPHAPARK